MIKKRNKHWIMEAEMPMESDSIPVMTSDYKEPGVLEVSNNKIYFYSDVDRDKVLHLVKFLKEKEEELLLKQVIWGMPEPLPIHLHIQSYGGWAHSGLAIFDFIRNLKVPVYTYVDGVSASAATLVSMAGKKRFISKNSFMLIHQVRNFYWGTYTHSEIKDEYENSTNLMKVLKNLYRTETKLSEEQLDQLMERDLYFNSEECLKFGLVDEVI